MKPPGGGRSPAGEGGEDPGLEELLRSATTPVPARAARERARERFLGAEDDARSRGGAAARTGPVMDDALLAEFERWLGRQPIAAPARAEFRAASRERFLGQGVTAAGRPRPLLRFGIPLLAAAAIVAITLFFPQPVRWKATFASPVRLAGEDFQPDQAERMAVALEGAGTLESLDATAHIVLGDVLELEVRPGTELAFPMLPELDGVSPVVLQLAGGEVYVAARPGWPGNPIRVHTEAADVELSGTTVGVLVDERGTCVCVSEGKVAVSGAAMDTQVTAGNTCYLLRGGAGEPEWSVFPPPEELAANPHVAELVAFTHAE